MGGSEVPLTPERCLQKSEKVKSLSGVQLFATPWIVVHQAPPSMEFSRQEYWSGFHFLLQGIFPTRGWNLGLLHCRQTLYHLSHQGIPNLATPIIHTFS